MKFTDKSIQYLNPECKSYECWDDDKKVFGLRVTPRVFKSFIGVYHYNNLSKKLR